MIGNLVYINTSRMKKDGKKDEKATEAGAWDGTIVYFGKFYNGIDKEDSFVEYQLSIEIIEDVKWSPTPALPK